MSAGKYPRGCFSLVPVFIKPKFQCRLSKNSDELINSGLAILFLENVSNIMRALMERYIILMRTALTRTLVDQYFMLRNSKKSAHKEGVLDLPSHTVDENKRIWNTYDWSQLGEEWTTESRRWRDVDPQVWKKTLVDNMMMKYIKKGDTVLEIGIGAGRWSEILQGIAGRLILADITKKCLDICKERLKEATNVEFHLIEDNLSFLDDNSIDYIWSYDVFVHINPSDIERYIAEFTRILKPGGLGILHHSGEGHNLRGFRSDMTAVIFKRNVEYHGMKIVEQNTSLPHIPGDVISVITKPS